MVGHRKIIIIMAVLLALVSAGAAAYWYMRAPRQSGVQLTASTVETKAVPAARPPAGLPSNLPIEPGSQILQNFEATTTADGRIQGTRKFTSKKSLAEAVKVYTDFFSGYGWTIATQKTEPTFQSVLMRRNDSTLLIVARNDVMPINTVLEITLTE